MLTWDDGNELTGDGNQPANQSAWWELGPVLTAKVSITATVPASHCDTYTLKRLFVPPG